MLQVNGNGNGHNDIQSIRQEPPQNSKAMLCVCGEEIVMKYGFCYKVSHKTI